MVQLKDSPLARWREEYARQPELLAKIEALATEHGEHEITVQDLSRPVGETAIFRSPTGPEYQRFTSAILGDKLDQKSRAAEILARNCVLFPDKTTFAGWIEKYPAIGAGVIKSLTRLAGGEASERGKE